MRWNANPLGLLLGVGLALSGCAGGGGRPHGFRPVSDSPVRVGAPYTVRGVTYTPADDAGYEALGYASWYGRAHEGRPTANGERFEAARISAAHTTLPLPSYVEVTALDSGRTIVVRVNDRGPFVTGRVIDLSRGAAEQLGIVRQGTAAVRVRRAYPAEAEKATLRAGRAAAPRPNAPRAELAALRRRLSGEGMLAAATAPVRTAPANATKAPPSPPPSSAPSSPASPSSVMPSPAPSSPRGRLVLTLPPPETTSASPSAAVPSGAEPSAYSATAGAPDPATPVAAAPGTVGIRVAAFAEKARADRVARYVGGVVGRLDDRWVVRKGPYAGPEDAAAAIRQLTAAGFNDARIVIND